MPLHNALRALPELYKGIGNFLGLGDAEEGLQRMSETLQPVVDPWSLTESAFLRRERKCVGFAGAATGAATNSWVAIHNPFGSGMVAVLEAYQIYDSSNTISVPISVLGSTAAPIGTAGTALQRDLRWSGVPVCTIRQGADYAGQFTGPVDVARLRALVNVPAMSQVEWVLGPGNYIIFRNLSNVNESIVGNFFWRERRALPIELVTHA